MVRVLAVIGLIMALGPVAFAEEEFIDEEEGGSGMYLGGKIGPSLVMVLGEDADDFDPAPGMAVGPVFKVSLLEHLALQTELLYEMKGCSGERDGNTGRQFLHYLTVPVLVKGVFEVEPVTLEPYAGLVLSLLVGANWETTVAGLNIGDSNTGDYNSIDLGIVFGGEVWFEVAESFYLTGDLRFAFGVVDIFDGGNDNGFYNFAMSFLLGAAYQF